MITFVDVRRRFAIIERAQSFLRNFNKLGTSKWHGLCLAPIRAQASFPSRAVFGLFAASRCSQRCAEDIAERDHHPIELPDHTHDALTLDLERLADGAGLVDITGANGRGKTTVMDNMHPLR